MDRHFECPPLAPSIGDLLSDAVASIVDELGRAARGGDTAYHLSGALDTILRRSVSRDRIDDADRDLLIDALGTAKMGAMASLPASYPHEQARVAMNAAKFLVWLWGQEADARSEYPAGVVADLRAAVRLFANDCWNISLVDEIAHRAEKKAGRRPSSLLGDIRRAWTVGAR